MSDSVSAQLRNLADRIDGGDRHEEVVCLIMGGDDPAIYVIGRRYEVALHRAQGHLKAYLDDFEHCAKGKH